MKVGELKALLADVSDDCVVILSSDAEGNSFGEMSDHSVELGWPMKYGEWEFVNEETEDDGDAVEVVVLWPV